MNNDFSKSLLLLLLLLLLLTYVNQCDSIQFSLTFFGRRRRRLAKAELGVWLIDGSAESYEAWRRCMQLMLLLQLRRCSFVATYDLGNLLDVLRRRVGFLSPLQAAVVVLFIVIAVVVVVVARHLFSTCSRRRCGCCRCFCSCCCGCCLCRCCCCWWSSCRLRCIICVWCHYKWY